MNFRSLIVPVLTLAIGCGKTPEPPPVAPPQVDALVDVSALCAQAVEKCRSGSSTSDPAGFTKLCERVTPACTQGTLLERDPVAAKAEFAKFEREQRTILFDSIDTVSFIAKLTHYLPQYSYVDRATFLKTGVERKMKVGPETYLFDKRAYYDEGDFNFQPEGLYYDWTKNHAMVETYQTRIREKRFELGLPEEKDRYLNDALYASIRSPSDEDLHKLYEIVDRIPGFFWTAMLEHTDADYGRALALIKENPGLYPSASEKFGPDETQLSLPVTRKENGEIDIPNLPSNLFFSSSLEATLTSYTKFLFRRGPEFTTNARIIFHCLRDARKHGENADAFIARVREHIPRKAE